MKKFAIREVETLKTTAADYNSCCYIDGIGWICPS